MRGGYAPVLWGLGSRPLPQWSSGTFHAWSSILETPSI